MGTRGLFGFYYKGKFYVVYNHWDSYPSGLGYSIIEEIIQALEDGTIDGWATAVENLREVDENIPPTAEDIEKLKQFTNETVGSQSNTDWYCLLRECQGSLLNVLTSGYILNCVDENGVPDWQEFAYIVNLDTMKLDFYGYEKIEFALKKEILQPLLSKERWFKITHSTTEISTSFYEDAIRNSHKCKLTISEMASIYGKDAFPSSWGAFILTFIDNQELVDENGVLRKDGDPNELPIWEIGEMTNADGLQASLDEMKADMAGTSDEPQFDMSMLSPIEWQNLYNFSCAYEAAADF